MFTKENIHQRSLDCIIKEAFRKCSLFTTAALNDNVTVTENYNKKNKGW